MRHRVKTRKLSRTVAHRKAMARNLVASLFEHERIETTLTKAKAHRPFAEKLITLAKVKNLHNYRRALALLGNDKATVAKLFDEIGPRFKDRPGGYTRILRLAKPRLGDNATRALFELVKEEMPSPESKKAIPEVEASAVVVEEEASAEEETESPEEETEAAEEEIPAEEEAEAAAEETPAEEEGGKKKA